MEKQRLAVRRRRIRARLGGLKHPLHDQKDRGARLQPWDNEGEQPQRVALRKAKSYVLQAKS